MISSLSRCETSLSASSPDQVRHSPSFYETEWSTRYDLGLIGGALLSMQEEQAFSEPAVELIVAAAKIGAFFGTFLGGGLMLYYGRRTTIALDSVFFMLGPITMASAAGLWCVRFFVLCAEPPAWLGSE